MNTYKHLTLYEREKIMVFHVLGKTITQIAHQLQRHKSTISRELKRCQGEYVALSAQQHYQQRRVECKPKRKLADPRLFDFVKRKFLQDNWSPEQIACRLKHEQSSLCISFVSIYRGIYAGWFDEKGLSQGARGAIRQLRHRGKRRHTKDYVEKRGNIPISHHLTERPREAEERSRLGDWEADTVLGVAGKACLLTLNDRKAVFPSLENCLHGLLREYFPKGRDITPKYKQWSIN